MEINDQIGKRSWECNSVSNRREQEENVFSDICKINQQKPQLNRDGSFHTLQGEQSSLRKRKTPLLERTQPVRIYGFFVHSGSPNCLFPSVKVPSSFDIWGLAHGWLWWQTLHCDSLLNLKNKIYLFWRNIWQSICFRSTHTKCKNLSRRTTFCIIPFLWNSQNKQVYRQREVVLGQGDGEKEVIATEYRVSLVRQNISKLDWVILSIH